MADKASRNCRSDGCDPGVDTLRNAIATRSVTDLDVRPYHLIASDHTSVNMPDLIRTLKPSALGAG